MSLAHVGAGWEVWSATRGTRGVDELGHQIEPLGGVVVVVDQREPSEDEPCGRGPRFLCLHPGGGPQLVLRWLEAAEINPDAVGKPTVAGLSRALRRLSASLAERRGDLTDYEVERVAWMHHLAGQLAHQRTTRRAGASPRDERDMGPPAPADWYVQ